MIVHVLQQNLIQKIHLSFFNNCNKFKFITETEKITYLTFWFHINQGKN